MPNNTKFPDFFTRITGYEGEQRMLALCFEHCQPASTFSRVKEAIVNDWGLQDVAQAEEFDRQLSGSIFGSTGVAVSAADTWSWMLHRLEHTNETVQITLRKAPVKLTREQ